MKSLSAPPSPHQTKHDLEMTKSFLRMLTGNDDEPVTFQVFDDTKKNPSIAKWLHLDRSEATFNRLMKIQKKSAGVYVMVNRGDGHGRDAEHTVEVRSLFIDLDGSPWEPAAENLKPHMRVESSPGRFHLYWLVSDCPLDQFKLLQQSIANKFDGDNRCVDLARVLRLPGFLHQKYEPVLTQLVELNDLPRYTTKEVIDGLGLSLDAVAKIKSQKKLSAPFEAIDADSGEVIDLEKWAARNPHFNIVDAIDKKYRRGNLAGGKQHIVCPFADQHTDKDPDLATFAANASPDYPSFAIHCCHDHCAGRDRLEFVAAMLERRWLTIDQIQVAEVVELRRPLYVTYQTNKILAAPEWTTLLPAERRIALDLMVMCWAEIDGCLSDDDWSIARRLGLNEIEWQEYRQILTRTDWLIVVNGRLTNRITKEEFDNAQMAYMNAIISGGVGGKKAAANRRASPS